MKKITEEQIFNLIDGKLSDQEGSEILKELPNHPEEEALYRSLLMTEGYIKASALEKTSFEFTDQVTRKLEQLIKQKKRNGILYRALSIVGFFTISAMIGAFLTADGSSNLDTGTGTVVNQLMTRINLVNVPINLSGAILQNFFFLIIAFTFFVFMDRVLIQHFHYRS